MLTTGIQMYDGMSPVIHSITNAMNICISSFESMQSATSSTIDTASLQAARREISNAEVAFNQVKDNISKSSDQQSKFNNNLAQGNVHVNALSSNLASMAKTYLSLKALEGIAKTSDQMVQTNARLNLINDGLRTNEQLQSMIFQSSQRARASYSDTANVVAKLGTLAKNAFSSNEEMVAFAEQMNKQFKIGGSSIEEQTAGMYQLTQAMASGKLQGDEFRSIMENAPLLAQAIANFTGKSMGDLRKMSAEGEITAGIIKKALFASAADTEARFAKMPKTLSEIWTSVKNQALIAFQPVLLKINEIANNPNAINFITMMVNGFSMIAIAALGIINAVSNVAAFFQSNWGIIEPLLWGIIGALIVYNATMGIAWLMTMKNAAAMVIKTLADWAETAAILALIVAQDGLNAALYACPLSWILIAIILLIAIFYAAVAAVNKFAGTSISATGIIAGVFTTAAAFIGNIIIALVNSIIDSFAIVYNFFAEFAEFFVNVFNDPVGSVIRLFSAMADTILQILEGIASAIDTMFGSSLANAVSGWRSTLQGWTDNVAGEAKIKVDRIDTSGMHLQRLDYGNAWNVGYNAGAGLEDWVGNLFATPQMPDPNNSGFNYDDLLKNAKDTADNTGKMKDNLEITDEDLKYLRDIAEQDAINRFTTAEIKVDMVNHNNINSELDLDGIIDHLGSGLHESLQTVREGATYSV